MSVNDVNKSSINSDVQPVVTSSVVSRVWEKFHENLSTSGDIVTQFGIQRDSQLALEAAAEEESIREGRRATDVPGDTIGRRDGELLVSGDLKELTIRVDVARLDEVLTLSGEIGLMKNRLNHLRTEFVQGGGVNETIKNLDQVATQIDLLVMKLQNAVMRTRMQPIGSLFKKYPRMVTELAKKLNKDVEILLQGESTELDKTILEHLNDPLVHLIRNAVDHGIEAPEERKAAGKPEKSILVLKAHQEGGHILITITDDGQGMLPELLRSRAVEKGLISSEIAGKLNDQQSLELIFLPGFSTKEQLSSIAGRGIGMDVVKTNIQKINGSIDIHTEPKIGTQFRLHLPLTQAILPVLILRVGEQSFAVPLSMVREIINIVPEELQNISGRATMVVRGEVLPVLTLSALIGWDSNKLPEVGVLMQCGNNSFILSADGFAGHDDVVVKPLDTFCPKGVVGVTMSSEGDIVLILEIKELLEDLHIIG